MLNRFKGDSDQVFLPVALSCSDAFFDYLAAMLVSRDLCEVLNNWLVDDGPFLVSFKQGETLSYYVTASDIATQFKDPATF